MQTPKEFKNIRKDLSLRLILKSRGIKQHCLPFCWLEPGDQDILEKEGTSERWFRWVPFGLALHFCFS